MSEAISFLSSAPLLADLPGLEPAELAEVLRFRELPAGEVLWREGDEAAALQLVVDGRVSVSLRLPRGREAEVASVGPGGVLGEIPLLDGGPHSGTARTAEPTRLLVLGRSDFAALIARRHPSAFVLKRRLAGAACARMRSQLATLAASLGASPAELEHPRAELEPAAAADSRYVRRMADFRAVDPLALWGFLTAGRYATCSAGRTLIAEGEASDACYVTINGAVEKVLARSGRRIRVGLAGPGQPFGYESLIDGLPSPVTETTRERTLLLVVGREAFERLYGGETAESHVFLDVVLRNLMASLRQVLRPQARLASRQAWAEGPPAPM
jgi:CRP/FNR family transcriptional regulator, cyclic AMP receptor protein